MKLTIQIIPGLILSLLITLAARGLSGHMPMGAVSLAILLGMLVGNILKPGPRFGPGMAFSEKQILSLAIALLGVNLDFMVLKALGVKSVLLIAAGLTTTLATALLLARILKFKRRFALLLGIGNGICGSSAIAATKDIIGATEEETGLSVAIVNFLGTVGLFLLPLLGTLILKFTEINTGILLGNTLQAVGQVVAAGFSVSEATGQTATIIKMTRILMLTPVILLLLWTMAGKNNKTKLNEKKPRQTVPFFIIGFFLFSLIPTLKLLPPHVITGLRHIAKFALTMAMAGVGMKITFSSLMHNGREALRMGTLIFVVQIVFSSSMILLFFQ